MSNTKCGMAMATTAVAATLVYRYVQPWMQSENAKLRQALEGGGVNPPAAETLIEDDCPRRSETVMMLGDVPFVMTELPTGDAPKDPECKKRIKKGCRGKFVRTIVSAVKYRIGTPKPTMANRRAVQRIAREEMQEFNLRKTVAATVMPFIVEACFVPDKWEMAAARRGPSIVGSSRRLERQALHDMVGFQQA